MQSDNETNREAETFYLLLDQLRRKISRLQEENRELREQISQLNAEQDRQAEENGEERLFAVLGESERIALKHQIEGLISKIDKHLEQN